MCASAMEIWYCYCSTSVHTLWHLIGPLLDAAQARTVLEIGTGDGATTRLLLARAARCGGCVHSVDIEETAETHLLREQSGSSFTFHNGFSIDVIPRITDIDAVLIDGDHNWHTVLGELRAIAALAQAFPLVLLHDVAWPYGRRDMYYSPSSIPPSFRHPYERKGLRPGLVDTAPNGGFNPDLYNALHEGGPRNGVRTAIEDWLAETTVSPRFLVMPGLHGLGILAPTSLLQRAPALAALLDGFIPTEPIVTHIHSLELDRLHVQIRARDTERTSDNERLRLAKSLKESMDGLHGILRTRSWRWTAPIRSAQRRLRQFFSPTSPPPLPPPPPSHPAGIDIGIQPLASHRRIILPTVATPRTIDRTPDIIIPTHNNSDCTLRCIASLYAHTKRFRVIWVDNGSSPEHIAAVQNALIGVPHIALLHPERMGFVRAANIGIAASKSETIILLNNDTEATEGWLEALLRPFDLDPTIGIVGPVTDAKGSWQGNVEKGTGHRIVPGMVAFFCAAIDREVIRRVGYLSEEYGEGFGDDNDYCARARTAGWNIAFAQDAFVRHAHRTTFHAVHGQEKVDKMIKEAVALFQSTHP